MLEHVRRDLTFRAGESVRVYAELYGLRETEQQIAYRATYKLLKTENAARDIARADWPGATTFAFDRARPARPARPATLEGAELETVDIDPRYLPPGTYLLRLEIEDIAAHRLLGRSTIALAVR